MLKKLLLLLALSVSTVRAYDPISVPNNRVGVHILDPDEINEAAKLVNSSGGDWGYVTIPIRSNDRDRDKWLKFFQNARRLHIIPIIRIATYPNSDVWVEPNSADLIDFANFLNDMPWPTNNRYIILFNEPNHANEWGGTINPYNYATLLIDARRIFKDRSPDFFLLSAGLDMASPNSPTSMDARQYYHLMNTWQPLWKSAVDGFAVHVYPDSRAGITSYKYEPTDKRPIFITETGWIGQPDLYPWAFSQVWTESNIVAVTPFILFAGAGEFTKFSLINSPAYSGLIALPKITGSPLLANITIYPNITLSNPPLTSQDANRRFDLRGGGIGGDISRWVEIMNNWFNHSSKLSIGSIEINIEIANNESKRAQGLSNRSSLSDRSGMLFVFPEPDRHSFWMKDMNFSLDFIWIRNGRVIQLSKDVPSTQPPVVLTPNNPVDQVLEVNAGFINKYGIKVGDEVRRR